MSIVEVLFPLSLYSKVKAGLRRPDDPRPFTPDPPTEITQRRRAKVQRRLVQMQLVFKQPIPPKKKTPPCGCIPGDYLMLRLRSRTLRLPPPDPDARWIWARPGYRAPERGM